MLGENTELPHNSESWSLFWNMKEKVYFFSNYYRDAFSLHTQMLFSKAK